jgi:hypothetical protein
MTTVSIDSELHQQTTEAAARGKTVDEFVDEALRKAVSAAGLRRSTRNGIPVMLVNSGTPTIDPATVRRCIEEKGI